MARETKIGLLVGMGLILMVGIFVTDYLANARTPEPARMVDAAPQSGRSITPQQTAVTPDADEPRQQTSRTQQVPLPYEQTTQSPPEPRRTQGAGAHREQFAAESRDTTTAQDVGDDSATWRVDPVQLRRTTQAEQSDAQRQAEDDADRRALGTSDRLVSQPQPVYHYVRANETLTDIAQRYYGEGRLWRIIRDANPTLVDPQGRAEAGARLTIPNKASLGDDRFNGSATRDAADTTQPRPGDDWLIRPSGERTVKVEQGQTLSDIAREQLGSAAKWDEIYELNRDVLRNPDTLPLGTVLKLPAATTTTPAAARTDEPRPAAGAQRTYTVKSGDSLSSIAQAVYGSESAWRKIADANRATLPDADSLKIGDVLILP